jgi:hypothetical protein
MLCALHRRIITVDMFQQSQNAQNIGIIDRIINGLRLAAGSHDIGPAQTP